MKIFTNTAISLDGKIATRRGEHAFFSSVRDKKRLKEIRNLCDAILVGGETFRSWPYPGLPRDKKKKPIWNVVVSNSLNLPFGKEWFAESRVRPLILTEGSDRPLELPIPRVSAGGPVTASWIVSELEKRGVNNLLVEGGGKLIYLFLKDRLVDEMYVTLCPKIVGDSGAPALVTGGGFQNNQILNLELLSQEAVGDEIFLHYHVIKK